MSASFKLSLKPGERVFINGAEVRVDRRVSLELLSDAQFLLSQHVLAQEAVTTPLRQLYVLIQAMLMAPDKIADMQPLYRSAMIALAAVFEDREILAGLVDVNRWMERARYYDALRAVRRLWPVEARVLGIAEPAMAALPE